MSPKIVIPIALGVAGASAATATTLSTTSFSSPEKCWYDDKKAGGFLEKVEKAVKEKFDEKTKLKLKDFIKSLCKMSPESSLSEFEKKFGSEDYPGVYDLLGKKALEVKNGSLKI